MQWNETTPISEENLNSLETRIDQVEQNVTNGKTAIATAVTNKGIPASSTDTFTQLSSKINQIIKATGGAPPEHLLNGSTASNAWGPITGTMPRNNGDSNGYTNVTSLNRAWPAGNRLHIPLPPGAYIDGDPSRGNYPFVYIDDPDFTEANIRYGIEMFGKTGTLIEGKKFASGTTVVSGSQIAARVGDSYSSPRTTWARILQVTGLGFTPNLVFINMDSDHRYHTIYRTGVYGHVAFGSSPSDGNAHILFAGYGSGSYGDISGSYGIANEPTHNFGSFAGGFKLPIKCDDGDGVKWFAYE
ncbi:hypothetical protein MO973_19825 [Paenibacillus sp. TRM 82003]|nr:hypothetical protein [Paenibacillus sp. TRM 82003]